MVTVRFRCGHVHRVDPDKAVVCQTCGEHGVALTLHAEPPRFSGTCSGPHAAYQKLDPMAVSLAAKPLTLKES